jgi:hypothetical protein
LDGSVVWSKLTCWDILADLHGVVRPFAPLGKLLIQRMVFCDDLIPERFEQST